MQMLHTLWTLCIVFLTQVGAFFYKFVLKKTFVDENLGKLCISHDGIGLFCMLSFSYHLSCLSSFLHVSDKKSLEF